MRTAEHHIATVSTSWDDDAASGMRVADLLSQRGIRGTFYVPTAHLNERGRFSSSHLRTLASQGFEIGSHTISHPNLTRLRPPELNREVRGCKDILQQILGREVTMFCYPKGRFDANVMREVENAGYRGARSTRMLSSGMNFHPFKIPTTLQVYPHARSNYVRNLIRLGTVPALVSAIPDLLSFENWLHLGKKLFDRTLRQGGIWHLYGHPWEIERLNLWSELEEMLDYVSKAESVNHLTNGQLLHLAKPQQKNRTEEIGRSHEPNVVN